MIILSYTSLSSYKNCPKFFDYRYVQKRKPSLPQNQRNFISGSCSHELLEAAFKVCRPISLDYINQMFNTVFEKVWADKTRNGVILLYPNETRESLRENCRLMVLKGVETIKKLGMDVGDFQSEVPIGTYEKPFELEPGLLIQGSADWVREKDNLLTIADFKTSKDLTYIRPIQLILYAIALERILGKPTKEAFYLMFSTGAQVNVKLLPSMREEVLKLFRNTNQDIKDGKFEANPSPKACSECVFRNICPASHIKTGPKEITF